jgi:hypothetical protein
MDTATRIGLFFLLFICSAFWVIFLIHVYVAGFIQYGLWPAALTNVALVVYLWTAAIVAAKVSSLPVVWTTPFYILLVIHYFASRRDALILRRYHREFWDERMK